MIRRPRPDRFFSPRFFRPALVLLGLAGSVEAQTPGEELQRGLVATVSADGRSVRTVFGAPGFYLQPGESLHPAIPSGFTAEWNGAISILRGGNYTFEANPAKIFIDGNEAGAREIRLDPGTHRIRMTYRRNSGAARLQLRWKSENFPWEPVPAGVLFHSPAEQPSQEEVAIEQGRRLFQDLGCAGCHQINSVALRNPAGPRLSGIGARTNASWIRHWLANPAAFQPDARMPAMLDEAGRRDVSEYLAGLRAAADYPQPKKASNLDVNAGRTLFQSLGCAACHRRESRPLEGLASKTNFAALVAYLKDPAHVDPNGRMPSMMLSEDEARQIAGALLESRNEEFERPATGGDPSRGKALVQSSGCLGCHELSGPEPLANSLRAKPLAELSPANGCLHDHPAAPSPRYVLTEAQRLALRQFVQDYKPHPDRSSAPVAEHRRDLQEYGCVNCHQTEQSPALAPLAERAPSLAGAGLKLHGEWIEKVVSGDKRILDHIELRMPRYSAQAGERLARGFGAAAGIDPGAETRPPELSSVQRERGHGMLGTNPEKGGLGCIGCHGWGEYGSLGEDGPELLSAGERLRYDWFVRWMRDPARILSGTSMPNYFGSFEEGEAAAKINDLWAAFSAADKLPLPEGFKSEAALLGSEARPRPIDHAIVIRWDMPEATPSAMAVGMPGDVSYCFDTGESRLRYAWSGGFVDMSRTLFEKKNRETGLTETAEVVGNIFYRPAEFPFRINSPDRIPQREYLGYRLVDSFPRFHYRADGMDIYERIVPAPGGKGIRREFEIGEVGQPLWFLSESHEGVAIRSSIGAFENGRLRLPQGSNVRFDITVEPGAPN